MEIDSITPPKKNWSGEAIEGVYVVRWRFPNGTNLPHKKTFYVADGLDAAVEFTRWAKKTYG